MTTEAKPAALRDDVDPGRPVTAPEIEACLAKGCDLWIFAYGSLMWNPGFAFREVHPALLRGYHRRFCVYSFRYRGTPERPGLVLGLDRGGACRGRAYRVAASDAGEVLRYLWDREMTNRVYDMREVPVRIPPGTVDALAFVVNRKHANYTGRLGVEETARLILQGIGGRGPCRDYLANTVRHLDELGIRDGMLHDIEERVSELMSEGCCDTPPGS